MPDLMHEDGRKARRAPRSPTEIARHMRTRLHEALASGDAAVARLRHARLSVAFRVTGAAEAVTVLLDRTPFEVLAGADAEVVLELDPDLAELFLRGELSMPTAVVCGDVGFQGPVRRYMEIDPIVRHLLAGHADPDAAGAGEYHPSAIGHGIDPSLLAIETRELHKSFGPARILQGLNVQVPEGMISVVLGPSGTGKSVLLQHIIGIMRPDAGDVLIRGQALGDMSRSDILSLRREIGVMFQDGALFSGMNIYDNVAFPLRQHTDFDEDEVREVVMHHLDSVGLADAVARMPSELSGGMKKRAGLARALVLNAGIVLCDEPDSGLDPVRTALLGELLIEQHALHGGTMVVVTHNVMLARLLADHMTIVWRGKVLESGVAEHVLTSETPFVRQFLAGAPEGPLGMDA